MNENLLIDDFLTYLRLELHHSFHTAKCYNADLRQFCDFLQNDSPPRETDSPGGASGGFVDGRAGTALAQAHAQSTSSNQVHELLLGATEEHVRVFLTTLRQNQYSESTITRKLTALRSFYKFCVRRSLLDRNPVSAIRAAKQEGCWPKFLEVDQIKKLLEAPDVRTVLGVRDRAMLETLYSTGIRVGELVALNIEDVDFAKQTVRVRGNGRKDRILWIAPMTLRLIRLYLDMRRVDPGPAGLDTEALYVNKHSQRLSTRSVRRKLDKYLAQAGLDPTISPHTLRHSFGIHMLTKGAKLRTVREWLGHRSPITTQIYEQLLSQKAEEQYEKSRGRA